MSQLPKHIVIREEILGYRLPTTIKGQQNFGILHAKPSYAPGQPFPGPSSAPLDQCRAATAQDFKDYRCMIPPDFTGEN